MGLRSKIKHGIKQLVGRLSGDYSAAAPEHREGYKRPGVPNEDAEVVMAQIKRPTDRK